MYYIVNYQFIFNNDQTCSLLKTVCNLKKCVLTCALIIEVGMLIEIYFIVFCTAYEKIPSLTIYLNTKMSFYADYLIQRAANPEI